MNLKYSRIVPSSFPFSAKKSRNRWRSSQSIYYNLFKILINPQRKRILNKRRQEVEHRDESKIFPIRHVFVFIVSREIEEKVPIKPLILMPSPKIVDNCLPLGFHWQFFCLRVPDITRKLKKNHQSEQDVNQVLYSAMDGWKCVNTHHGDAVLENARHVLCSLHINIKKARQMRFSTAG